MTVAELAKKFKVNPDTIRHYVKFGLLSPERDPNNGYKVFNNQHEQRLKFILRAKSLGFSLADIKLIIEQSIHGQSPCPQVREIMAKRLVETEQQIAQMQATYQQMKTAMQSWQAQPNCNPTGDHICHLIENFAGDFTHE
ncbi:MerR family transcriptional regulator [Catenovulum sp. 2E275]|uniref:MerR family transcriptional regulator n=1 Tax=Catenovulum sp. 2E275 TaxID=2980497 RepID=UPI0021D00428|nr:MerR family transcriptional regulator [Catenovulum sp. 2E275]MCU4675187.1 MerR family transcriptional regulator [Catenovulum sp. 2E275]